MDDAIQAGFQRQPGNMFIFDADVFARNLGLDSPNSAKFRQTERLMQQSGGMAIGDLQQLVEIARRASQAEIPDVSSFIARRATIGGIDTAAKTVAPWAVVGASSSTMSNKIFGALFAIGGSRLISNIISDPRSARALGRVIHEEARTVVRRSAAIRALAFASNNMISAGEATRDTANAMMEVFDSVSSMIVEAADENDGKR